MLPQSLYEYGAKYSGLFKASDFLPILVQILKSKTAYHDVLIDLACHMVLKDGSKEGCVGRLING